VLTTDLFIYIYIYILVWYLASLLLDYIWNDIQYGRLEIYLGKTTVLDRHQIRVRVRVSTIVRLGWRSDSVFFPFT